MRLSRASANALLAASLLVNAAGLGYLVYRVTRTPPAAPDTYRMGRIDLFDRLATTRPRIVMLGDSLTDRGEWHELLGEESIANRGIAGDTIRGALARVGAVTALDPAMIVVMLGINDLLAGRSVEDCAADHAALLAALRTGAPRARIVIQSVLPVRAPASVEPGTIEALNAKLRALCAEHCTFVDLHAAMVARDGQLAPELTNDGVHLTGLGYLRWRDMLRSVVDTAGR